MTEGGVDWNDAEKQVRTSKGERKQGVTVSVKSGANGKRKAGEAVADAVKEVEGLGKKSKKGKEGKGKGGS